MDMETASDPLSGFQASSNVAEGSESPAMMSQPPSTHTFQIPNTYHPLSLPVLALLAPASIFGTLARLGLQALVTYDGQCIFPLAFVQAIGCLIMGFILGLREPFGRFYGPLYTALTTGFCGSLTTFSGWQLDIFNSWVNADGSHRDGLRDFLDGIGKTVFTLSLSFASVSFGARFALAVAPRFPMLPIPNSAVRYTLTALAILTYAATFPLYFGLSVDFRYQVTAAILLAYPGTLTRHVLSVQLNALIKSFPLGTFVANALGTALLGTFHVLQSTLHPPSLNICAVLQGLSDGYCGCLTTVSTFAVEAGTLKGWEGFRYVFTSWMVGQVLLLTILGPSFWHGHVKEQVTCRFG